ncbi:hypothetical protein BVC80_1287g10 [Macleaya cordata]|uniref:Uncharacterized protein n=1 Tax=Macleaya cordata TaxID=56857 RepID=A0A200Q7V0_MACCD|nr:hypothetical protein BVC80_1287g10 [Macleaya cordata]
MLSLVAAVKRNLRNVKKTSRIADENMFGGSNNIIINRAEMPAILVVHDDIDHRSRRRGWNGLSVIIYSVIRAPFWLLSCIFHPPHADINGNYYDGAWVSGHEFARVSEMNHLMVNESLRYQFLM